MGKGMKHYTKDGLYTGETHKMEDGSLHTGKTHTKTSKVVSHKKEGPFKMNASPFDSKKGLWANIHAKSERIKAGSGETKANKGDSDYPETLNV